MSKHTPGPWVISYGKTGNDFSITEQTGRTICEPNMPIFSNDVIKFDRSLRYISDLEAEANARLIAAAPELLEACKLALNELTGGRNKALSEPCLTIEQAIAKAEGGK